LAGINLPATSFTDKVCYRMANDRRAILATFADRVAVRDYVRDKLGDAVLSRVYAATDAPEAILHSGLPRQFVLKTSHGSRGMVFVGDHVPRETRLPTPPVGWERLQVHPDSLEWDRLMDICRHWLALRYEPYREWAYTRVKPRVLIEELLVSDWRDPVEYKFFVFGGTAQLVSVPVDRFGDLRVNFYTPEWESLDVTFLYPRGPIVPKPTRLDEMITIAERLSDGIDFVRVDLYNIGERVVFGELTNYPNGGWSNFEPLEFDDSLGAFWRLE
jgi:hypothetical protein